MGSIRIASLVAVCFALALGLTGCGPFQPATTPLPAGWVRHEVKLLDAPYVALSAPLTWREVDTVLSGDSILSLNGPQEPDPLAGGVSLQRYRDAPTSDGDWVTWIKGQLGFDNLPGVVADEERVTTAAGEALHEHLALAGMDIDWYAFPPRDDIVIVVFFGGDGDPVLKRAIVETFEYLQPLPSPD